LPGSVTSRILILMTLAVAGVAGCDAAPGLELTPAEQTRLLFPALLEPPEPASDRCGSSRPDAPPPPWLAEAARQTACTDAARAALDATDAPATSRPSAQDLLTAAALCENSAAIERAFAAGADPNGRDSCGWTALVAAAAGHPDSVRTLLAAGASAELESSQGAWSRSPLLAALIARDVASARLLVAAGAPVNVATPGGRSALMFAASIHDGELVQLLLRRHADPCHSDIRGLTPLVVARVHGNAAGFELLRKASRKCDVAKRPAK
jgi:ankyrin repeat protein